MTNNETTTAVIVALVLWWLWKKESTNVCIPGATQDCFDNTGRLVTVSACDGTCEEQGLTTS